MHLHVKGFVNGFAFFINEDAVSVHEALLIKGRKFHKATINALNRKNVPFSEQANFELLARILWEGLSPESARALLRQKFNIDVLSTEYYELRGSEVDALQKVYNISKYRVQVKEPMHSTMYYFHRYLTKTNIQSTESIKK